MTVAVTAEGDTHLSQLSYGICVQVRGIPEDKAVVPFVALAYVSRGDKNNRP